MRSSHRWEPGIIDVSKTRVSWIALIFSIWPAIAFGEAFQSHFISESQNHPIMFAEAIRMPLAYYWFWAIATPLIIWMARRYPLHAQTFWGNLFKHVAAWLGLSAIHALLRVPMHSFIYPMSGNPGPVKLFTFYFIGNL